MSAEDIIAERDTTHGNYAAQSAVSQAIKKAMAGGKNWSSMLPPQREALELIAVKLARIVSGDPYHLDHWLDICGYAKLGSDHFAKP